MFDLKKLEAFLDSLEVETHFPSKMPRRGAYAPVADPAIEQKMDKYDIFKQGDYKNVGTPEFPIWAKPMAPSIEDLYSSLYGFANDRAYAPLMWGYGGIQRGSIPMAYSPYDEACPPPVEETPHQKLQKKITSFANVAPVKIENPKPVPPAAQRSPDYVHTLTAWRGWGVDAGKLVALGTDYDWEPKEAARAKCRDSNNHPAPHLDCVCGFWSFKTLDLLAQALTGYLDEVMVVGTVEIWGRVIECENGFRSEYAYPKELWLLSEDDDLSQLSWNYGVPVRKYTPPCTALVLVRKMK